MMKFYLTAIAVFAVAVSGHATDIDGMLDQEIASQTGTAITIIFDTSGSMSKNGKMVQAKKAFSQWLETIPERYALSLITFRDAGGHLEVPLGRGNRADVKKRVLAVTPNGKTPITACLKIALSQIAKRRADHSPYERHIVIVFTDGGETVDPRKNNGVNQDILNLRRASIEVAGIGFYGQGAYMQRAATVYYDAKNTDELATSLSSVDAEIGDDRDIEISEKDRALIQKTKIPLPKPPIPNRD